MALQWAVSYLAKPTMLRSSRRQRQCLTSAWQSIRKLADDAAVCCNQARVISKTGRGSRYGLCGSLKALSLPGKGFFCSSTVGCLISAPAAVSPTERSKRTDLFYCVHYYKDAMLGRFYAICNCCSCCCGAMQAHQNGTPMLASSGYVTQVDVEMCAGCGTCAGFCQFAAISVDDGVARIDAVACMGCGVCVSHCPEEAISLRRDPAKGEPLEIQKLIAYAAQATER